MVNGVSRDLPTLTVTGRYVKPAESSGVFHRERVADTEPLQITTDGVLRATELSSCDSVTT